MAHRLRDRDLAHARPTRRRPHLQIEFTRFPGYDGKAFEAPPGSGWVHLPLIYEQPWSDDDELVQDAVMRMVDYAIQHAPEAFSVSLVEDDYEVVNDLSIQLAEEVHAVIVNESRHERPDQNTLADWLADVDLVENVVRIRVSEFS